MQRSRKPDAVAAPPPDSIRTVPGDPCHQDELLDEAIQETFPASDPVSISIETPEDAGRCERKSGK